MKSFEEFCHETQALLVTKAQEKAYNQTGVDGENLLYDFIATYAPGHPLGEVIYKVIRYQAKKNPEDLLKAAAWLFLVWRAQK